MICPLAFAQTPDTKTEIFVTVKEGPKPAVLCVGQDTEVSFEQKFNPKNATVKAEVADDSRIKEEITLTFVEGHVASVTFKGKTYTPTDNTSPDFDVVFSPDPPAKVVITRKKFVKKAEMIKTVKVKGSFPNLSQQKDDKIIRMEGRY